VLFKGRPFTADFRLRCLEHVVNLVNIDIMAHITKLAVIETMSAIWEYDPLEPDNHVLGGGLDVIATIWTLAIKVRRPQMYSCTNSVAT
jgi:hypothetical protein